MMQNKMVKIAEIVVAAAVFAALAFGCISPYGPGQPSGQQDSGSAASVAAGQVDRSSSAATYKFRTSKLLKEHYGKHGKAMGFADAQEYQAAANAVIANPDSLHKVQREDGDDVYYLEATDELVVVSTDGYIRTYFNPGGIGYFNRQ